MPRYFFNVRDGSEILDEDGTDLPDIYAAQAQAIRTSGEILRDLGARFWDGAEWRVEVSDARGTILFVLRFSAEERLEAADETPDPPPGSGSPAKE